MFIRVAEPLPPGSYIQLLFDAPEGEIRARAVVRRSTPKQGMAVGFVAMQPEDRARLSRWLNNLSDCLFGTDYFWCRGTHHSGMILLMRNFRTSGPHCG